MIGRPAAFGGSDLEEIFRGDHGDEETGPVGNGVAEEGPHVGIRIRVRIKNDPDHQDDAAHDAERVMMPKAFL